MSTSSAYVHVFPAVFGSYRPELPITKPPSRHVAEICTYVCYGVQRSYATGRELTDRRVLSIHDLSYNVIPSAASGPSVDDRFGGHRRLCKTSWTWPVVSVYLSYFTPTPTAYIKTFSPHALKPFICPHYTCVNLT